ncbi:DUF2977 domain-containing protein [Staphylococcus kloosii]|jgi:hypothetical protein|uniref:DUF2977 domain-containing protein n=1 Tax=Staphylococcus kloosii TaxID=29384 RepID=UPI000D1F03F0|nr:DUF2977 domain-containing protein [Staphylococcus kloosii]MBF7022475.1 DUF2977 domain-containing protein [Staphylococcus kloosii]PTJ79244.1 hypothetical protein BUZ59_04230 [Staphylococcus kloosii]
MRILINENNEIVGYATVGGLEGDFEIDDSIVPLDFTQKYKSKYYLYQNEQIVVNPNYQIETPIQPTPSPQPLMSDDTLKYMVATLQKQSVQSNMKINKLLKDNQDLKTKVSELENKEVTANE